MPEIGIKLFNNKIKSLGHTDSGKTLETIVTTIEDNQDTAEVEFFLVGDTSSRPVTLLGKVVVKNIPPARAGEPKIIVVVDFSPAGDLRLKVRVNEELIRELEIPGSQLNRPTTTVARGGGSGQGGYADMEVVFSNEPEKKEPVSTAPEPGGAGGKKRKFMLPLILIPLSVALLIWLISSLYSQFASGKEEPPASSRQPAASTPVATTPVPTPLPTTPQPATGAADPAAAGTDPGPAETRAELVTTAPDPAAAGTDPGPAETRAEPISTAPDPAVVTRQLERWLPLYFYPDTAELLPDSRGDLEQLTSYLADYDGQFRLTITGHAADAGSAVNREAISLSRAAYVRDQLINLGGWSGSEITVEGRGAREPVYSGEDRERFTLNRRVEIRVEPVGPSR